MVMLKKGIIGMIHTNRYEYQKEYYIKNKDRIKKYSIQNKDKKKAYLKEWNLKNKDKAKAAKLKRNYNLTLDQYNKMLSDQNGCCKVCSVKFDMLITSLGPNVDHCHKTNKVRGLLCINCNTALGKLKDDTKIMQKLIKYIKEHNE